MIDIYKAKATRDGEWVQGNLTRETNRIMRHLYKINGKLINQETICQCSGLRANLELVFEKDILQYKAHDGYLIPDMVVLVAYNEERGCWGYKKTESDYIWPFCEVDELQRDFLDHCAVIGNLIDNPELTR